ncbi:hypothetical protein DFR30_1909 [Thiogranum longum]|uniref:EF hand domain-containing protein n=1 Tax=Thiogranum longum TaxID=1537524 RepID=A0A4R1HEL7_9GAMM|nr:hypothetical protein [Thiogranum longum]TCK18630.1 hypothetical protein DFR30_1909 [Thiogranum longum]
MKTSKSFFVAGALLVSGAVVSADFPATFESLDTDGDGYVSSSEAGARKDLAESWQTIDKNTDDRLDITEFDAFEGKGRYTTPEESEVAEPGAAPY